MIQEARIEDGEAGTVPADDGWWILNLGEIAWEAAEGNGAAPPRSWSPIPTPRPKKPTKLMC